MAANIFLFFEVLIETFIDIGDKESSHNIFTGYMVVN